MKVYKREDFIHLPDWFWVGFDKKNKDMIIKSGYPIIPILIMICEMDEEIESSHEFWNLKNDDATTGVFNCEFYEGDYFVSINFNTIEYYITDKLKGWDFKSSYEELISGKSDLKNNPK